MLARLHLQAEQARASLFFVPTVFVVAAMAAAAAMLQADIYIGATGVGLPAFLQTTPESARSLLSTVAAATITVAGVVFAITLVSIQLAASQFSPRVIPGFLRDSRQQRVMGLAVGTFAYCLVVLPMRPDVRNGSFVAEAQAIGVVWPAPDDPETFAKSVSGAIVLGDSRVLLTDVACGIRQLVDIGLRALSPGINDPTTAYDVIVHLGIVVRDLLWRDLMPAEHVADGRRLVTANDLSHDDYVNRAFDQIRLAGAMQSAIAASLMQALGTIAADLERDALAGRAKALRRQGALALATYEAGSPLYGDLARVRALAERYGFHPERSSRPPHDSRPNP